MPSFFQTWTWTGCLAAERFPDPVLVEAVEDGQTVALALFNRVGRTLHLGESGDPALDTVYVEYNGVLTEAGREAELTEACVRPRGVGHLEDPSLATDLMVAMDFIASGLITLVTGVASAVVVAVFHWWAGALLAAAWLSTHRSGVTSPSPQQA